jgi:hypothetical protein
MRNNGIGSGFADTYPMGEAIKKLLTGAVLGYQSDRLEPNEIDVLIDSRPKSVAEALRQDMLRVEHDFRRAFNKVRAEADGEAKKQIVATE